MDYVFINEKWYYNEFVQSRVDTPQATRISGDFAPLLLKKAELMEISFDGLESYMQDLQDTLGKVLQLHKDSNIDVWNLRLDMGGHKKDVSLSVNTILKEVNSIKTWHDSYNNEFVVTMNTSYWSLSKTVEKSLTTFSTNMVNTVTYFLVKY